MAFKLSMALEILV